MTLYVLQKNDVLTVDLSMGIKLLNLQGFKFQKKTTKEFMNDSVHQLLTDEIGEWEEPAGKTEKEFTKEKSGVISLKKILFANKMGETIGISHLDKQIKNSNHETTIYNTSLTNILLRSYKLDDYPYHNQQFVDEVIFLPEMSISFNNKPLRGHDYFKDHEDSRIILSRIQ